jgi:hypothetical protein
MAANTSYVVKPTAINVNPILGDYIDRESKALHIDLGTVVVAGVNVKAISTVVGDCRSSPIRGYRNGPARRMASRLRQAATTPVPRSL